MNNAESISRKTFLNQLVLMTGLMMAPGMAFSQIRRNKSRIRINFGLVSSVWGKDWDLPALIENLTSAGIFGLEIEAGGAHGVDNNLVRDARRDIRRMLRSSPVQLVGISTNLRFDYPDRGQLRESIDKSIEYIRLGKDLGSSGIRVKAGQIHPDVPKSRTVEQIGQSLNQIARIGADHGQQIRLEVSDCGIGEISVIKDIMDLADHPNATLCWGSNPIDLTGAGLEENFNLLKNRLGSITHVHDLSDSGYPYRKLIGLLVDSGYRGWLMLNGHSQPTDIMSALVQQRKLFEQMIE